MKILAQNNIERIYCEKNYALLDSSFKKQSVIVEGFVIQDSIYLATIDTCRYAIDSLQVDNARLQDNNKRFIRNMRIQTCISLLILTICLL